VVLDRTRQTGSIEVTIDAASIDTGLDELEKVLRGPGFFDVEKFPTLTFRASHLRFEADRLVSAEGELTMLGVTRPVTLAMSQWHCGIYPPTKKPACGAEATARIRRSDFGMKASLPGVADDVRIAIQIEAFRD
jgi:polyisoprenoid-binding protein YceI